METREDSHQREEGKRILAGTGHAITEENVKIGGEHKFQKNPPFIQERNKFFEELYAMQ